ncbi:MAG: DUF429 domain-containing protein [Myxococcota bacterium]|nr:DUF429 domain-containing protein [Myxococcota bacterium]
MILSGDAGVRIVLVSHTIVAVSPISAYRRLVRQSFRSIDLAWSSKHPTGLAALLPGSRGLEVVASETRRSDDDIVAFVSEHLAESTVVMVDAPLVVPNVDRMRECDRETHRRFGRFQAGAYPANRTIMGRHNGGDPRGEVLVRRLGKLGFPTRQSALPSGPVPGRLVFECYPHPAQVVLFGLSRTLKYKKKRRSWEVARREFTRYLGYVMGLDEPCIDLPSVLLHDLDPCGAVGKTYKEKEDRLDAIFCAYLAALVPLGRIEMLGKPEEGGIVVPTRRS